MVQPLPEAYSQSCLFWCRFTWVSGWILNQSRRSKAFLTQYEKKLKATRLQNLSMQAVAQILRARAIIQFFRAIRAQYGPPNFASTFKLNGAIWYASCWHDKSYRVFASVNFPVIFFSLQVVAEFVLSFQLCCPVIVLAIAIWQATGCSTRFSNFVNHLYH